MDVIVNYHGNRIVIDEKDNARILAHFRIPALT